MTNENTQIENAQIENFMVAVENNLTTTLAAKAAALPDGFQAAKFQQNCISMLKGLKKADLLKIKPEDVISCLMKAALLDLDFASGECYALPYWNKDEGKNDLNFQTDYKGEDKIAKTYSIKPIFNTIKELVRKGDKYQKIIKDGNVYFEFEPVPFNNAPIVGAFAQVTYTDGSSIGEDMSLKELDEIRKNFSKAQNSPAYTKTPGEMYKKIVFRRLLKNVAKSFKNSAQQIAYSTCSDFEFNNQTGVSKNSEAIRNPFVTTKKVEQITTQKIENETAQMPQNEFYEPEVINVSAETEKSNTGHSEMSEFWYEEHGYEEAEFSCANCGIQIDENVNNYSNKFYGRPLCRQCQKLATQGEI